MPSLYVIDQQILSCCDTETGEILIPELLDSLMMERNAKIESVALWVKNLESDAAAFKAEKDAFAKREEQANKKAESLKNWLAQACNGQAFNTTKCAVSFRRSEKVDIVDKTLIPAGFLTETVTVNPNKKAIKDAIKAGQEINGCRLVESLNTQIK